jgi:hypothetical protein
MVLLYLSSQNGIIDQFTSSFSISTVTGHSYSSLTLLSFVRIITYSSQDEYVTGVFFSPKKTFPSFHFKTLSLSNFFIVLLFHFSKASQEQRMENCEKILS